MLKIDHHLKQLLQIKHPNLLQLKEFYYEGNKLIQIYEYNGVIQSKLQDRFASKISQSLVTQYILQLLFALNYLQQQNIDISIDMETVFLNSYGSLRIHYDLLNQRSWVQEVKQLQSIIKGYVGQSHELQAILRCLLQPEPPSVDQLINHPYLLKAMFDFCKQQESELKAENAQEKLIKLKQKEQKQLQKPTSVQRNRSNPQMQRKPSQHKIVPPTAPKLDQTQKKQDLQQILQIYKNQLKVSVSQHNPWLVMSEIKEDIKEYESTTMDIQKYIEYENQNIQLNN
ncbi:hypothetical protein pb186bvf_012435 [Paramecium bursaria]